MKTTTKVIVGTALIAGLYGVYRFFEPEILKSFGPLREKKLSMPERGKDLTGTYQCDIEFKSTSEYFRKRHGFGYAKNPDKASLKFVRKGLRTYEITDSRPYFKEGKPFIESKMKAEITLDGDDFSFSGIKETEGLEFIGRQIPTVCKIKSENEGEITSDGIAFTETKSTDGKLNSDFRCDTMNNEGTFMVKYDCKRSAGAVECKDDLHRAVFIRPCPGQLFTDQTFTKTRVGSGTIQNVCQDLRESCVTDIFIGFKADHDGKGCGMVGTPLFTSKKQDEEAEKVTESLTPGTYKEIRGPKDPIMEIMKECADMNIHAWFPVFNDEYFIWQGGGGRRFGQKVVSISDVYYSEKFADPENPEVVEYQMSLLNDIAEKYPIIGINLDYIRYASKTEMNAPENYKIVTKPGAVEEFVKKVKESLSTLVISADIYSGSAVRQDLAQNGVPEMLNLIMPLEYTYFGSFGGPEEVSKWAGDLRAIYPDKNLIPILRGWSDGIEDKRSKGLVGDLSLDIAAARVNNVNGYSIFTYESLLSERQKSLKELKDSIGF